ncbi:MAG TPA: hypothetical protein VF493_12780 [Terriglobales bacterium]
MFYDKVAMLLPAFLGELIAVPALRTQAVAADHRFVEPQGFVRAREPMNRGKGGKAKKLQTMRLSWTRIINPKGNIAAGMQSLDART